MRKPIVFRFLILFVPMLLLAVVSVPSQTQQAKYNDAAPHLNSKKLIQAEVPNGLPSNYPANWSQLQRRHLSRTGPLVGALFLPALNAWAQPNAYIVTTVTVLALQMALIVVLVAQIEKRKRSEREVKESEEQFRLFASAAAVLIWMSSADKLCNHANRFWLDFTGRNIDSAFANNWAQEVHPDDLEKCTNFFARSFDRQEEFSVEYRLRRRDGEYRWVLDTGVPRFNSDRSFAGYVGSIIDVTEPKRAAEEVRESEERNRQRVRDLPVAMVVDRSVAENNVLFNARFMMLFGFAKEDVPDMDHWWRQAYPEENYRAEVKATWQVRVEQSIRNRTDIDPMQARVTGKDGSSREIQFYFSSLGETAVVSFVDLTERKQSELGGSDTMVEIVNVNGAASSSQMAASLAHELAQPLAAILSNAQAAERFASRPDPDLAEIRDALADITEDDRRARAVIENMRAMFQRRRIVSYDLDLNQVVMNVHRMVKNAAASQGVQLQLVLVPGAVQVRGDESILQQVFLNLVSNGMDAMKHTSKERRILTLTTTIQAGANCGIVLVEDHGKGISDEEKSRLFTPFFTTKSDGLGMGLSISRSLVESLGGRLTLENRPEPGAAFRVSLPLAARAKAQSC
jgi:two-component system, LuxR family, sensor kinase FixL